MKWIEVGVSTKKEAAESVSEILMDLGAQGVEIIDPEEFRLNYQKHPYKDEISSSIIDKYGDLTVIKAYYSETRSREELKIKIESGLKNAAGYFDIGEGKISITIMDDRDWSNEWKKYYKPFYITDGILIKPSWEIYNAGKGETIIEMDPGMAFGTGIHETTKMCSDFLLKQIKQGSKVLDIGCGTGILSIISVKLGAGKALAVDIDDAAIRTTRENIHKNGVDKRISVIQGELHDIKGQVFDIIVANIISDVLLGFASEIRKYLDSDGRLILSGIIRDREKEVRDMYVHLGYSVMEVERLGEWVAMLVHA